MSLTLRPINFSKITDIASFKMPSTTQAVTSRSNAKENKFNPAHTVIDSMLKIKKYKKDMAVMKVDAAFLAYEEKLYTNAKKVLSHFKQAETMSLTSYLLEWLTPTLDQLTSYYFDYQYANHGLGNGVTSDLCKRFEEAVKQFELLKQKLKITAEGFEDLAKYVNDELKERFQPLEVPPKVRQVLKEYYFYVLQSEFEELGLKDNSDAEARSFKLGEELLNLRNNLRNIYFLSLEHVNQLLKEWRINKDALPEEMKPVLADYQCCFQDVCRAKLNYLEITVEQAQHNLAAATAALEKYKQASPIIEIDIDSISVEVKSVTPTPTEDFVLPRSATASPKPLTDKSAPVSARHKVLMPKPAFAASQPRWNISTKIDVKPLQACSFLKPKSKIRKGQENPQLKVHSERKT